MDMRPSFRNLLTGSIFLLALLALTGCSSSSSGGHTTLDNIETVTADLGTAVKNVQLTNGVPAEITFTYTIPGDISAQGDFTGNLTKTLNNISLTTAPVVKNNHRIETLWLLAKFLVKEAFAASDAMVSVYISFPGDTNVCSSSTMIGPYTITGAIGSALTSSTSTVTPTQPIIDIVSAGSFEVCIVTTPPIDAYLTITGIVVDFEPCGPPTVNIENTYWMGPYTCTNFGVPNDSGTVYIDITRNTDGSYHYVDDGGAEYDGHLCGNIFKFNGGITGSYTESGAFTFTSDTTATKTSNWTSISGTSGGTCSDDLSRI